MDNPCVTLPISENWVVDYTNLRCQRDYQVDSGWKHSFKSFSLYRGTLYWNNSAIKTNALADEYYIFGESTYFTSSNSGGNFCNPLCSDSYYVRLVQNKTDFKYFNSF